MTSSAKITAEDIARLKGENLNTTQKRLRRGCVPFERDANDTRRYSGDVSKTQVTG